MEQHLRDAIELNRQRAPLYAEASGGESLRITRKLIRQERLLLPVARWFDSRARRYQRAGIDVMGDIFLPMSRAPCFLVQSAPSPPTIDPPAPGRLRRVLRQTVRKCGFIAAATTIDAELKRLAADPDYWCMIRHLLESARRVAVLAPSHAERARHAGLPSPLRIHRLLFQLHLLGLKRASDLDALALPLQRRGVPILSRDLPPIE